MDAIITQSQLNELARYLDALWEKVGMDMRFSKHFLDRVNDARNIRPITLQEVSRLFVEAYKKFGPTFAKLGKRDEDIEGVLSDMKTNVNSPFAIKWQRDKKQFELLGQTVMRKKNFVPNKKTEKKYTVEAIQGRQMFGNPSQDLLEEISKVKKTNEAHAFVKEQLLETYGVSNVNQLDSESRERFNQQYKDFIADLTEEQIMEISDTAKKNYQTKALASVNDLAKTNPAKASKRLSAAGKVTDDYLKKMKPLGESTTINEQDSPNIADGMGARTSSATLDSWHQRARDFANQSARQRSAFAKSLYLQNQQEPFDVKTNNLNNNLNMSKKNISGMTEDKKNKELANNTELEGI